MKLTSVYGALCFAAGAVVLDERLPTWACLVCYLTVVVLGHVVWYIEQRTPPNQRILG